MTTKTAFHEAGHAVAAYVFDIAIRSASIKPKETHLGIVHFNASGFEPDLDCAVVFACGPMAARMAEGKSQRTNWLAVDDSDIEKALRFIDRTPDPMLSRQLVELRSRSLLFTRWPAVLKLADALDRQTILVGPQVEELLQGVRRARGEQPIDPAAHFATTVDGTPVRDRQGHQVSLRRWATVLDSVGHDTRRALELVAGKEGKDR